MSQHILFVDDEMPIRETLSICFRMKGIKVTTAETGQQALRLCLETNFDLVILDVNLGKESGLDLLPYIKESHPNLPVIIFTSEGDNPELLAEALAKGASAYMGKTESLDNLLKVVQRTMQPAVTC